jgi:TIR domain
VTTFISYSRLDGAWLAERLVRDLPNAWLDTLRIGGGRVWSRGIEQVLDAPDTVVVALLTPGSFTSEICRAEHLRALRHGRRLIPVLASLPPGPGYLSRNCLPKPPASSPNVRASPWRSPSRAQSCAEPSRSCGPTWPECCGPPICRRSRPNSRLGKSDSSFGRITRRSYKVGIRVDADPRVLIEEV